MNPDSGNFPRLRRDLLTRILPVMIVLYGVGYMLKVGGWILVHRNGGGAGPFPSFLPQTPWVFAIIGMALMAIFQVRRWKIPGEAGSDGNTNPPSGGDLP
jgi:hypothetical protein